MSSSDHLDQRDELEEEQETLIPDEKLGETSGIEDDGIGDLNDCLIEVEENSSRPQIEAETGSSGGLKALDSGEHIASERENDNSTALDENIQDEEDHKVLESIETLQGDPIVNQANHLHQLNARTPLELFDVELPNGPVKIADRFDVETEMKDENILEMNIKVIDTKDHDKKNYHEYEGPVDRNELEEPENSSNYSDESELLDITKMIDSNEVEEEISLKESRILPIEIESTLQILPNMEDTIDTKDEINQEKTEDTEITGLAVVALDNINIEDTSELTREEGNCNVKAVSKKEGVLEMNIKVEESTTKHVDPVKENKLSTLVYNDIDKKGNHAFVDSNGSTEEIIDSQNFPLLELENNGDSYEFSNGLTELYPLKEPATDFDIDGVKPDAKNFDVKEEAMREEGEKMPETNVVDTQSKEPEAVMSVAFIPKKINELIEFIDSETLEVTQDKKQPSAMSDETVKEASSSFKEENDFIVEESPMQLNELKVELVPVVPPRPLKSLGASSPELAAESDDNVELQEASADPIKSSGRSGIRKPEWIRRSLRKGSVRRLFGRMKSKRFNHDRLPVTPPLQPAAPQRPLRQIIVDFLLLLFES